MKKDYPVDSWTATRNAAIAKIKKAAGDDDLLDMVYTEVDPKQKRERESNCEAVDMIVRKAMQEYREGAYDSFPATIKKLCAALGKLK